MIYKVENIPVDCSVVFINATEEYVYIKVNDLHNVILLVELSIDEGNTYCSVGSGLLNSKMMEMTRSIICNNIERDGVYMVVTSMYNCIRVRGIEISESFC